MTKQLTPLRRKDQAIGYQAAVRDIVAWLREEAVIYRSAWAESVDPRAYVVADSIEAKFGGRDDQ